MVDRLHLHAEVRHLALRPDRAHEGEHGEEREDEHEAQDHEGQQELHGRSLPAAEASPPRHTPPYGSGPGGDPGRCDASGTVRS